MSRAVHGLAKLFALLGGAVLSALILITCLSIVGRSLNSLLHADAVQASLPKLAAGLLELGVGPINGDFELVEAGMAFAIFAFLPLCQLQAAHASVDIFTNALSPRLNRVLRGVTEVVFAAVLVVIAWQLFEGMQSKRNSGQTTFLLEFPLWWAYALSLSAAVATAFTALYVAAMRLREVVTGAPMPAGSVEAET